MIASVQNPLVKYLVRLRQEKNCREENDSVLIMGSKLIQEIATHIKPKRLFVQHLAHPAHIPYCNEMYQVSAPVLKKITGLVHPEPLAAEFPLPKSSDLKNISPMLVLEGISDPGNLGTLVRTALAFGWQGVFFLPGCADPFHEKVIRSARAALFNLPYKKGSWEELEKIKDNNQLTVYVADLKGMSIHAAAPKKELLLLLSNEAQGVSDRAAQFGQKITIPMHGNMESLNVAIAGSILMHYLSALPHYG